MRYSSVKEDSGYPAWCKLNGDGKVVIVKLNGVIAKRVITVDTDAGEIVRMTETEDGNVAVDRNTGEILYETVTGAVEIEIVQDSNRSV